MSNGEVKRNKLVDIENLYSKEIIESLKTKQYNDLKKYFSLEELNKMEVMEQILYAVKNEYNTYIIYKYCGEDIQRNSELASEVITNEAELIEETKLSRDREFIRSYIKVNPDIVLHMSQELKGDVDFLVKCIGERDIGKMQIESMLKDNPELAKQEKFMLQAVNKDASAILLCDKELKENYIIMEKICRENEGVIDYVADNTTQFGKEGLKATKDVLVDTTSENIINEFSEELDNIRQQTEESEKSEDEIKQLTNRSRQLQRHIDFLERVKSGKVDAVRAAKPTDRLCKNVAPEYAKKVKQVIKIDNAIVEKGKEVLESGVKATEASVGVTDINNVVKGITEIQKNNDKDAAENDIEKT